MGRVFEDMEVSGLFLTFSTEKSGGRLRKYGKLILIFFKSARRGMGTGAFENHLYLDFGHIVIFFNGVLCIPRLFPLTKFSNFNDGTILFPEPERTGTYTGHTYLRCHQA